MDALLLLAIASFTTCIGVKRNLNECPPKVSSLASRKCYKLSDSWAGVLQKKLMAMKPRFFFYSIPQDHIREYLFHGHHDFDTDALEDLNNFPEAILMPTHPKNLINMTTKNKPLAATKLLPLIAKTTMMVSFYAALSTALAIILVLVNDMMPFCHAFKTSVVSAKTPLQSNGMIEKCTILPLESKLPKMLTQCNRLSTCPNHV